MVIHSTSTGCVEIYQCDDSAGSAGAVGFAVFVCFCLFLLPSGLPCAAVIQSIAVVHHLRRFNQLRQNIICGDSMNCVGTLFAVIRSIVVVHHLR
jgi:hypothetical protein